MPLNTRKKKETYDGFWNPHTKRIALLAAGLIVVVAGVTFVAGEMGDPDPAVVASPSPAPTPTPTVTEEERITQKLASFIASHPETDENIILLQQMIVESGCDFSEAFITTKEKRRDAEATIYKLPSTHTGALAQVTYGEEEGRWLVLGARVVCGETSPPTAE